MNFHNVKRFHCTLIISYFILKIYLIKLTRGINLINLYSYFILIALFISTKTPPPVVIPEEAVSTSLGMNTRNQLIL